MLLCHCFGRYTVLPYNTVCYYSTGDVVQYSICYAVRTRINMSFGPLGVTLFNNFVILLFDTLMSMLFVTLAVIREVLVFMISLYIDTLVCCTL